MGDEMLTAAIAVVGSVVASSGFWAWIQRKDSTKSATKALLLGLAHDKIISQGYVYIERGWLSKDEYDDYMRYFVKPYSTFGGNGMAEKVVADVERLPMHRKPVVATGPMDIIEMKA